MRCRRLAHVSLLLLASLFVAARADAAPPSRDDADVQHARELFTNAIELAKQSQWSEALRAFEDSAKLRPHAITTYDIGVCERAIGLYTQARATLQRALAESAAKSGELPDSLAAEAKAYLLEIDGLLVQLDTTIQPSDAALAIDGRPLQEDGAATPNTLVAGIAAPGRGEPLHAPRVTILLDPGTHVFTLSRRGFADVVVRRTFGPGTRASLMLVAERLPAMLHVSSNQAGAAVSLDGVDVGATPIDLTRPGGHHSLFVRKAGYTPYRIDVNAEPGADLRLNANLDAEKTPIYRRWWFWTGALAVVGGAIVATYFITRPAPERPAVDGGGLGWTLDAQ